jgi:hypothetical protein
VYVLANVPRLWNVPAVLVRVSVQVSVADRDVRPRSGGDIRLEIGCEVDETDEADEPECLLVGEDDLEEYPVVVSPRPVPYPAVLLIMGAGRGEVRTWRTRTSRCRRDMGVSSSVGRWPSCLQKM